MRAKKIIAATTLALLSLGASMAVAQQQANNVFRVGNGASQKIDRFNVCRIIKNSGTTPIMVPTSTATQWHNGGASFLHNISKMPRISAEPCGPWYEGVHLVSFIRNSSSGTWTYYTWRDGTESAIGNGFGPAISKPSNAQYDPNTGECSPRKSLIAVLGQLSQIGPIPNEGIWAMQLCETDGMATSPNWQ